MRQIINLYYLGEMQNLMQKKLEGTELSDLTYFRFTLIDTGALLRNFFKKKVSMATTLHLRPKRIILNSNQRVTMYIQRIQVNCNNVTWANTLMLFRQANFFVRHLSMPLGISGVSGCRIWMDRIFFFPFQGKVCLKWQSTMRVQGYTFSHTFQQWYKTINSTSLTNGNIKSVFVCIFPDTSEGEEFFITIKYFISSTVTSFYLLRGCH